MDKSNGDGNRMEWVNVRDGMPDEREMVWIYRPPKGEPEKGRWTGREWVSMDESMPVIVHWVTHWMRIRMPEHWDQRRPEAESEQSLRWMRIMSRYRHGERIGMAVNMVARQTCGMVEKVQAAMRDQWVDLHQERFKPAAYDGAVLVVLRTGAVQEAEFDVAGFHEHSRPDLRIELSKVRYWTYLYEPAIDVE